MNASASAPIPSSPTQLGSTMPVLAPGELSAEDQILCRIADIEAALVKTEPEIRVALVKLDRELKQRPDLLHILTDANIGTVFKAMQTVTQSVIVQENKTTGKGVSGKTTTALKKTSLADL